MGYINKISMLNQIAQIIYDKKGFNIMGLDVQGQSSITDYLLIAEGNVDRHTTSLAKEIMEKMDEKGEKLIHAEGLKNGDWIVLDYGDVMIHLFSPGWREKYSLERLWPQSKLLDLVIKTGSDY